MVLINICGTVDDACAREIDDLAELATRCKYCTAVGAPM